MGYWILLSAPHINDISPNLKGRDWTYEVAICPDIRSGDIVYFWRTSNQDIYGWGLVTAPTETRPSGDGPKSDRTAVRVSRIELFSNTVPRQAIEGSSTLRGLLPASPDDLAGAGRCGIQAAQWSL